jgi:alpha-L-rhamnosidase
MADESSTAWAEKFIDPESGKVGSGSQSELSLALGFGAAPDNMRDRIFEHLVADVTSQADGPSLTTGIYGTRLLLEILTQNNRHDIAYGLANRQSFPSWGWMLHNGATTLWETWKESDNTFSHNHPMFGSISAWFFRHLGGIQIADNAVGADRIIIHPQIGHGLTSVNSSHRTIRGTIVSNWKTTEAGTVFEMIIPPDTLATVRLPSGTITESGKVLSEADGVLVAPEEPTRQQVMIGSGSYRFHVTE